MTFLLMAIELNFIPNELFVARERSFRSNSLLVILKSIFLHYHGELQNLIPQMHLKSIYFTAFSLR